MSEEFKKAFSELDLEDKRNELNNEMKVVFKVLDVIKQRIGAPIDDEDSIREYEPAKDNNLNESQMLDLIYFDFHVIQKNVLDIADALVSKDR